MGRILQSKVIYKGNIIDNYLANFPQFINKQKDSIYKLVIGQKVTCFVVNVPEENYTIRLPYYQFKQEHAQFISWGDGVTRKGDPNYPEFLEHTYKKAGVYQIYIMGETPQLFSIFDNCLLEQQTDPIYQVWKQNNMDYYSRFEYTEENSEELETLQNISDLTEEEQQRLKYLKEKKYVNNLKSSTPLLNFMNALIGIKKISNSLTDLRGIFKWYPNLSNLPDEPLPTSVSSCQQLFYACSSLTYVPFNFTLPEEGIDFRSMFAWSGLKHIFNQNLKLPFNTSNVQQMFRGTKIESIPNNLFYNVTSSLTSTKGMFRNCINLLQFNTTKKFEYITNIDEMFLGCESLKKIKFNLPNLNSLYATCLGCSSLNKIEGFHINQFTRNANYSFSGCTSLNQDVSQILEYWTDFNLVNLSSTFENCLQLRGTPKEQYLWKSYTLGHLDNVNTFKNCTLLNNYNWITSGWGGPDDVNYWYGSFEIKINDPKQDIYCLPIYKFLYGDKDYQKNQNYNIFSTESGILAPYNFYINYGDETAWHHVTIGDNPFFDSFWQNDKTSPFYGYPKTYKINFDNDGSKMQTYQNLINNDFFGYIYKDVMHRYKLSGSYKVMIIGQMPRFYVHHTDFLTNRLLFNIYTVNKLPFTTLDHAFTNAINLIYLPNQQLIKFPILSGQSNWESVQKTISGYPTSENTDLWPIWTDGIKNCIISTALNTYSYYENNNQEWLPYSIDDNDVLSAVTEVSISALTRDDLLREIPTSATNYCFANGNGLTNYLNPRPLLFDINQNQTTFKYRT